MTERDPRTLLRLPDDIEPYPAEPSDAEVAAAAGIDVERIVRFDMNTLGGGPLPAVVEALRDYDAARLVEYGDQAYRELRGAISRVTGAPQHRVIPGAGADELIRLVSAVTVAPGSRVVIPTPAFPMYAVEARLAGGAVIEVPRAEPSHRQPIAQLRQAAEADGAALVWLCSPNNPTGDRYPLEEIAELADGLASLVVVDAVYQELAEASEGVEPEAHSLLPLQDRHPNVVILRSLAKSYGLAGARVGYLIVADALADRFDAARLPLSLSGASEAAAIAALSRPADARARHRLIVDERARIHAALQRDGWEALASVTNFVLARPPAHRGSASAIAEGLLGEGLVVRSYPSGPLVEWLRITARAPSDNDRLLAALGLGVPG